MRSIEHVTRLVPIFLVGLFLGGCGRPAATPPADSGQAPTGTSKNSATIKADPNPAAPIDGKFGKTTITWDTGNGSPGDVFVSYGGGEEKIFAAKRPKGSLEATWIGNGVYEFRLYIGNERTTPAALVRVTQRQP